MRIATEKDENEINRLKIINQSKQDAILVNKTNKDNKNRRTGIN